MSQVFLVYEGDEFYLGRVEEITGLRSDDQLPFPQILRDVIADLVFSDDGGDAVNLVIQVRD